MSAGYSLRQSGLSLCAAAVVFMITPATAQAQEKFPKTINLVVGSSAGGTFDEYARLAARQLEKFLPGKPNIVVQHMPAAGGIKSLNWLYANAPKDGSAIATMPPGAVFAPLQGLPGPQYDATRFRYLASIDRLDNMLTAWHTAPFKAAEEVFKKEMIVGNTGGSSAVTVAMINSLVGTKFKIIAGYPGSNEITMAMERGEVDGTLNFDLAAIKAKDEWLSDKLIRILMQINLNPIDDEVLKGVPTLGQFVKDQEVKDVLEIIFAKQELGRVFIAPPETPAAAVDIYRQTFSQFVKDADFLAQAKKMKLSITLTAGEDLDRYVKRIYSLPKSTVDRMLSEMASAERGVKAKTE